MAHKWLFGEKIRRKLSGDCPFNAVEMFSYETAKGLEQRYVARTRDTRILHTIFYGFLMFTSWDIFPMIDKLADFVYKKSSAAVCCCNLKTSAIINFQ